MRSARLLLVALAIGVLAPLPAAAQYPAKTVKIIVGTSPGGSPDVFARLIAQKMSESWGPMVVENRIGANGNIAAEQVSKSAPDGYTAYVCDSAIWAINPHLYAKVPYRPLEDFAGISTVSTLPTFLTVHPSVPAATYAEFIAYAKQNPGKLAYASAGNGSIHHITTELFKSLAGISMVHVPYKGMGQAGPALIAGDVQVAFSSYTAMAQYAKAGKVRILASADGKRTPALPDIPTISELGIPGFDMASMLGALVPAGVPRAIIERLNAGVVAAVASPEVNEKIAGFGVRIGTSTPEQFDALMRAEHEKYAKPVKLRGEAHHMGFTDDRRFLWAGGLENSRIHVFDIATDPGRPRLVNTITNLAEKTGYVGPHTYYALPGRMLVQALSNARDKGGVTGIALYNNKGDFITSYAMPVDNGGDGYGYDLAVNPRKNVLLTSSFTGYNNYMRSLGEVVKDPEAMKRFGNTMLIWDLKAMKPQKVFSVPGAPLEIRWSLKPGDNWAVAATALTSKIWLVKQDAKGEWQAKDVATIGDPTKIPLPVDISITRDGKGLWVNTFMDGKTRYFDLSNPEAPKQTYEKQTGKQVNMISQSWDGKRVYITSSLLANWDKGGADNEQFLRGFSWNGKELKQVFEVDFTAEKLGRAHHMKLGSKALRTAYTRPETSRQLALNR